jgi:bifunctional DNA-binding transcriptional regulator/antitoxin component of YhaV-PrlF toxin-antitoxin module
VFTPILGRKSVIPKGLRESLKPKKGDTVMAKLDDKNGLLIYTKK